MSVDDIPGGNQVPMQQASDATIRSIDSSLDGQGMMTSSTIKTQSKIKAYVDFSDFNKNYEEYLKRTGQKQAEDTLIKNSSEDSYVIMKSVSDQSESDSSSTSKDWEVLS